MRSDGEGESEAMIDSPASTAQDRLVIEADAPTRVDFTGGFTDVAPLVNTTSAIHVNAAVELRVRARVARVRSDPGDGWQLASDLGLQGVAVATGSAPGVVVSLRSDAPLVGAVAIAP